MKAEASVKMWQPPGWSPPGAVDFLPGLIDGGDALAEWARSVRDVRWAEWLAGQGVAPYAWHQLKAGEATGALPAELSQALRRAYYAAVADGELHEVELRDVLACLAGAGVTPVLFKGAALAHTVYPDPACRPMGDLDLWVTEAAMPIARAALVRAGYREHEKAERPLELQRNTSGEVPLMGAGAGQGLVELHWGTFAGEWLRRTAAVDEAEIRCRARVVQVAGREAWTLSPEDAVLQLAVHFAVNHQMAYPGVRGLLDVRLLASADPVDWAALAERARMWRVRTCTWLVLSLTRELLGLPGADAAIAALAPSRWRRAMLRRFVDARYVLEGRDMTGGPRRLVFQLLLVDRPRDAARLIGRTLWPERAWLQARYGGAGLGVRVLHSARAMRGRL